MSDQENFLSRWSRRKREVAEAEAEAPKLSEPSVAPKPQEAPPEAGEKSFDLKTLPSIESITAETDIRAFLAPGVPAELKRAALRRAWSADPAIRDFVGLSENSWDFNAPGAMAGFGPLDMTEDLRRMAAQLLTPAPDETAKNPASESSVGTTENAEILASEQDESAARIEETLPRDQSSQSETNIFAMQQQPSEQAEVPSTVRRCHGGALPK